MKNGEFDEPSVLDYVKDRLSFWRKPSIHIPAPGEPAERPSVRTTTPEAPTEARSAPRLATWPWRSLGAIFFALIAQALLEPGRREVVWGVIVYWYAAILAVWAYLRGEWHLAPLKAQEERYDPLTVRRNPLLIGLGLSALAFVAFGNGRFNLINTSLWIAGIALVARAFWSSSSGPAVWLERIRAAIARGEWRVTLSGRTLLALAVIAVALFFRFYRLNTVPLEMTSDHAEKMLDMWDLMHGQYEIFFPRNTGREAVGFYWLAAVFDLFGTGYTYLSLKIGTALMGFLTLPFIYLLGKEIANRRVGMYATLFAAVAYWPNVVSRVGLRFPLYMLFTAPTLYYLVHGLRTMRRNDFIWAGIFLGLGLQGYSSFRIVPFVVITAVAIYLIHTRSRYLQVQSIFGLSIIALISFLVFLPLFRYTLSNPEQVFYRSLTRVGTLEHPLPGSPVMIFLSNLWEGVTMFFWSDGQTWLHSVPGRPALDVAAAGLFFLGALLVAVRWIQRRNWQDLFWIVSIPLLLMPSILSLAFPGENPSLNRPNAAIIPVFLLVGLAFDGLTGAVAQSWRGAGGKAAAVTLGLVLLAMSSAQSYDLVFNQWNRIHRMSTWNSSEIGGVIRAFAESVGTPDSAWVIPYPYWVDTRVVGIVAGYPTKDYALDPKELASTVSYPEDKLFILYPQDQASLQQLEILYPTGELSTYHSQEPTKDFLMFFVPRQKAGAP